MAAATKGSFKVFLITSILQIWPLGTSMFLNMKTNLRHRNSGSNNTIIDAADEHLENQEEGFYFEGISQLEQCWRKCIEEREIILRNNGTISALGHSQSSGAENFLVVPFMNRNIRKHIFSQMLPGKIQISRHICAV